jgi:hypothetical protein
LTIDEYCRDIESYLCQKNDGHLIRIVGPSFDLVAGWARGGVPIKVAFSGIDRAFARYHGARRRRRPLKIDFCDADVLDAFDAWRRAVGLSATGAAVDQEARSDVSTRSLPAHLQRVVTRLSNARASGLVDETFDPLLDAAARELDAARASPRGLRGDARHELIARLDALDRELLQRARAIVDERTHRALVEEAEAELSGFRDRMDPDAFDRIREAAVDRLLRERFQLPVLIFQA